MMEIAEQPPYPALDESADGGLFVGITGMLQEESRRLVAVAESCRTIAEQLAEREATMLVREQAIAEAERDIDRRAGDLDRWRHELEERAACIEEAKGRIAEASEREASLRAMAESLLERYRDSPHDG